VVVVVSVVDPLLGDEPTLMSVFDSVLLSVPLDGGFTIVVSPSFFSPPGTTVVFSWQAASRAAPARMQIYFFIIVGWMLCGLNLKARATAIPW
jgi:hypothetical protein